MKIINLIFDVEKSSKLIRSCLEGSLRNLGFSSSFRNFFFTPPWNYFQFFVTALRHDLFLSNNRLLNRPVFNRQLLSRITGKKKKSRDTRDTIGL